MRIKKGDIVQVIAGKEAGSRDNRVKRGKVLAIDRKTGYVIVERLNFIKRHTRPNRTNRQGGIVEKEGPIHHSNLMVVAPGQDTPERIGMVTLEDGKKVRAGRRSGEHLD
ncbi:MAG: 50S ribosomal protein L24 [Deltaproteobacteria bacterium]|nr:50S ribosomal protein L24 [Deltaproteobacteria bacterium]MCB9479013.1 50S ribosomal protein L24 [Deltaproteobacteria bacterium]MCB9487779.1 50S ribosomal protein L24 [Deltaproteobacteria bacterium]